MHGSAPRAHASRDVRQGVVAKASSTTPCVYGVRASASAATVKLSA
jgi:hypothetical protein